MVFPRSISFLESATFMTQRGIVRLIAKTSKLRVLPDVQKNMVSGLLLNKHGFRLVFKVDKFVLTKSGMYVGKGYLSDGMFKLNIMTLTLKVNAMNEMKTSTPSIYMLVLSNLWHGILGHVNFDTL